MVRTPEQLVPALRRAFSIARNGRPGPVLIEIPADMWNVEVPGEIDYTPTRRIAVGARSRDVDAAAAALITAKRPLIYAGQGVHYAKAWDELKAVAELLEAPVYHQPGRQERLPRDPSAVAGLGWRRHVHAPWRPTWQESDVVFGAGASFSATGFGIQFPTKNKTFIHNTLDPHGHRQEHSDQDRRWWAIRSWRWACCTRR